MLNQEEDHLSGLTTITTRSTTDLKAVVIDLSLEADQTRQRKDHVSLVAKKATGNVIVQTEDKETMVNKK